MSLLLALNGHGAMSDLSPLCEQKRTLRRPYFSATLEHAWAAPIRCPKSRFSAMQSTDGNSEDKLNEACAELLKIFSDPSRSPQKAYRTYLLTFENGEPVFTLSEADRILEGVFEGMFDRGEVE
jgi:hypothetical protein